MTGGAGRDAVEADLGKSPDPVSNRAGSIPSPESFDDDFVQNPAGGWRMACDGCHRDFDAQVTLFANIGGKVMCCGCWTAAGCPFPRRIATPAEIHAAEIATRERMQKRGGADRHMVRNGKS